MGARNNIHIYPDRTSTPITIYAHWGGDHLRIAAHQGIMQAHDRWHDQQYATRIIMHTILNNICDEHSSTGAGIALGLNSTDQDIEYLPIHINVPNQVVLIGDWSWTFSEYNELFNQQLGANK